MPLLGCLPFRENVPKSSSVSKTRANYVRKNSDWAPPWGFGQRRHTVNQTFQPTVYSRPVMTAIISSTTQREIARSIRAAVKLHRYLKPRTAPATSKKRTAIVSED